MIPTERWCPRCRRAVSWGKAYRYGRRMRECQKCGTATKARKPKALRGARQPLNWKRTAAKAAGDLQPDQWDAILRFYGFKCAYCETAPWTQQDHVHPISRGGLHTAANVVPSCARHNMAKGRSLRWHPRRRHPFMVQADVLARDASLSESFDEAPLKIGR